MSLVKQFIISKVLKTGLVVLKKINITVGHTSQKPNGTNRSIAFDRILALTFYGAYK